MWKCMVCLSCLLFVASSVSQGYAQVPPPPSDPPESPSDPPDNENPSDDGGGDDDDDDGGGGGGGIALAVGGAVLIVGAIAGGLWAAGAFSNGAGIIGTDGGATGSADEPITIRVFGDGAGKISEMEMGVVARVRVLEW